MREADDGAVRRSMGLISIDTSGPTAAHVPPNARLGSAPGLQALREPSPRLGFTARPILQRSPPGSWPRALRGAALPGVATLALHAAFAAAFLYLLSFHDPEQVREVEIPVEVVSAMPETPKPVAVPPPPKPPAPDPLRQALAQPTAPDPKPPAPPAVQPTALAASEPKLTATLPPLAAAPPEPMRAATQDRENRSANVEPDVEKVDQAIREAHPQEMPRTLTTSDPAAVFAVPPPAEADPTEKPAPPIPAKAPSESEKLAAALPMDVSAMPMSFRAVLSGNGAQVSAAYKGLVYGKFNHGAEIVEQARRQHLKGQVIVAFSIDDAGKLKELSVLQSSGRAAVDALGLEMIRSAAPFPPPPPDAQRSFTPALTFGD